MPERPETALYFTTVVAIQKDLAIVGGHLYLEGAYPSVSRCFLCMGNTWRHLGDMPDIVYAATRKPGTPQNPRGTLCLMGRKGLYREIVSGSPPTDSQLAGIDSLYLMDLRYIAGALYVCGVQNQVLKQVGGQWIKTDQGMFAPFAGQVDRRLESIDGFGLDDIYAVGGGGAIWHWDGRQWTRLDSPTNAHLNIVLCASDGSVHIGGAKGIILRGRRDRGWSDLSNPDLTTDAIEDMTEFQGSVFATATTSLLRIKGDDLETVDVPVRGERCFYAIDSTTDALWCVGSEAVLRRDEGGWQQFTCPDNV
jgi:hypothetical protein